MVPCHADVVHIRENVPGDNGGRRGRGALATVLDTKASTSPSKNGPTEVRDVQHERDPQGHSPNIKS